jgi:hypothetical protein
MVVGVKLHYFGVRLESGRFLDPKFCEKLRSKFA